MRTAPYSHTSYRVIASPSSPFVLIVVSRHGENLRNEVQLYVFDVRTHELLTHRIVKDGESDRLEGISVSSLDSCSLFMHPNDARQVMMIHNWSFCGSVTVLHLPSCSTSSSSLSARESELQRYYYDEHAYGSNYAANVLWTRAGFLVFVSKNHAITIWG
jgi:hypothetical protein